MSKKHSRICHAKNENIFRKKWPLETTSVIKKYPYNTHQRQERALTR